MRPIAFFTCLIGVWLSTLVHAEERPRIDAFTGKNQKVEFEALVMERLMSDGFWCGNIASFQGIRYRVTKIISGDPGGLDLTVYHALIGPPLCEKDDAVLSKHIFAVGNRLRLVVDKTPSGVLVGWESIADVTILSRGKEGAEPGATDNPGDAQ